jgi:hypothetical protein
VGRGGRRDSNGDRRAGSAVPVGALLRVRLITAGGVLRPGVVVLEEGLRGRPEPRRPLEGVDGAGEVAVVCRILVRLWGAREWLAGGHE